MDDRETGEIRYKGSASIVDVTPTGVKRRQFPQETPLTTNVIPEEQYGSYSFVDEIEETIPVRLEGVYRETIREWWIGRVEEVHSTGGYFNAMLQDVRGNKSIAEFDIDTLFQGLPESEIDDYLFPGSEFVMYVVNKHGQGAPQTVSCVEFTPPYIWKQNDDEKAEKYFSELFPDDPFIQD